MRNLVLQAGGVKRRGSDVPHLRYMAPWRIARPAAMPRGRRPGARCALSGGAANSPIINAFAASVEARAWARTGRDPPRIEEKGMHQHVTVTFGNDKRFEYKLTSDDLSGLTADQARKWFDREFQELECDVPSPMGKVLLVDRILTVARYSGERRFREQPAWAAQFARHAAVMTGREVLRVDVEKNSIDY
jgi:hypothetical protein